MSAAYRYVVAGRRIASDTRLPELPPAEDERSWTPAIEIRFAGATEMPPAPDPRPRTPDAAEPPEASPRISHWRDAYLLDFPPHGQFSISRAGDLVRCFPAAGSAPATSRQLLLDQVLPFALSLSGDVVLHAGAVAVGNDSVAFAAAGGHGKSTLVAYLGTRGAEALTDDCLVLRRFDDRWHAIPYYEGVRLWPESLHELAPAGAERSAVAHYTGKQRVLAAEAIRFRPTAVRLGMLLFLGGEPGGAHAVQLTPLSQRAAFFAALEVAFCLEREREPALRGLVENLALLVETVPAYELSYARRFSSLPSVRAAVLSRLRQERRRG